MTRAAANEILSAVRAGASVPQDIVLQALVATGDLYSIWGAQ